MRGRGTERGHIGTTLRDPFIDYGMMAAAYGMAVLLAVGIIWMPKVSKVDV